MGYLLAVITSLLALFFGYLYIRKSEPILNKKMRNLPDEMSRLLTDFNRVSNTNINLLEEKIKDLREVIELADEKIRKMNALMVNLEQEKNLFSKPSATKQYERIQRLTLQVKKPEPKIGMNEEEWMSNGLRSGVQNVKH